MKIERDMTSIDYSILKKKIIKYGPPDMTEQEAERLISRLKDEIEK